MLYEVITVERLQLAIDDANEMGILGENILGSDFSFNLEIRMGSGAFVCGEETALIANELPEAYMVSTLQAKYDATEKAVITSYSIHYTKLYEDAAEPCYDQVVIA